MPSQLSTGAVSGILSAALLFSSGISVLHAEGTPTHASSTLTPVASPTVRISPTATLTFISTVERGDQPVSPFVLIGRVVGIRDSAIAIRHGESTENIYALLTNDTVFDPERPRVGDSVTIRVQFAPNSRIGAAIRVHRLALHESTGTVVPTAPTQTSTPITTPSPRAASTNGSGQVQREATPSPSIDHFAGSAAGVTTPARTPAPAISQISIGRLLSYRPSGDTTDGSISIVRHTIPGTEVAEAFRVTVDTLLEIQEVNGLEMGDPVAIIWTPLDDGSRIALALGIADS